MRIARSPFILVVFAACAKDVGTGLGDSLPGGGPDGTSRDVAPLPIDGGNAPPDAASDDLGSADASAAVDSGLSMDAGPGYGSDCPQSASSTLAADSPRLLLLGPLGLETEMTAVHLEGMLAGDPAFRTARVVTATIARTSTVDPSAGGGSLANFFYYPEGRGRRLAVLDQAWSYVILLEQPVFSLRSPEIYFEGVRTLGCRARATGAKPIVLMTWGTECSFSRRGPLIPCSTPEETDTRGEIAYRVANGTGSIVVPSGYALRNAQADAGVLVGGADTFIAAAAVYTTLTGRSAADTAYRPASIPPDAASHLGRVAFETVASEGARAHYTSAYHGPVEVRTSSSSDFWFMDSGTSSEHIWFQRMNDILPRIGLLPQGIEIGFTNPYKAFDADALRRALPFFAMHQYQLLFARDYWVSASTITSSTAPQARLQVQVWDRHADATASDGLVEVARLESRLRGLLDEAAQGGFAAIPYHLMFAKMKTVRPSIQLLSDGVHATYPVGYGLAAMSIVSRTGVHVPLDGLDPDSVLGAELGEETIRQLASLSASGSFVPDVPGSRPRP